jgi:hypothetical protein
MAFPFFVANNRRHHRLDYEILISISNAIRREDVISTLITEVDCAIFRIANCFAAKEERSSANQGNYRKRNMSFPTQAYSVKTGVCPGYHRS